MGGLGVVSLTLDQLTFYHLGHTRFGHLRASSLRFAMEFYRNGQDTMRYIDGGVLRSGSSAVTREIRDELKAREEERQRRRAAGEDQSAASA